MPGLALRAEYLRGRQPGPAGSADVDGWYAYAVQNIGTRHQFAVRLDEYDPNADRGDGSASWSTRTLGGSYIFHWDANSKVMLAYETPGPS